MHWRDRVQTRFDYKARRIAGVGSYMERYGSTILKLTGCFRFRNIRLEVNINEDSKYKQRMEKALLKYKGQFVELHPRDSNEIVILGLNELAGRVLQRGFRTFMTMLSILSGILFSAMLVLVIEMPEEMHPEWALTTLLLVSVAAFLVYSFSLFGDRDSSWHFTWTNEEGTGMMNDVIWEGFI